MKRGGILVSTSRDRVNYMFLYVVFLGDLIRIQQQIRTGLNLGTFWTQFELMGLNCNLPILYSVQKL